MSGFPGSPRTLPGAIVAVDPLGPPRAIVFQYNPDEVTRILKPRTPPSGGGSAADVHRIWGAPSESISLTLELDATDGLADADPVAVAVGVAGPIAALELLLYPGTATVLSNTALLLAGTIEVLPPQGPVVVLVWGPGRVVPVTVTGVTIREQAFSPLLVPIRASVEVGLDVLSYDDMAVTDPGYPLFVAHQVAMEALAAAAASSSSVAALTTLGAGT
jgi:hypothetical protein